MYSRVFTKELKANGFFVLFLVGYVEERPRWPIQSPNIGGKRRKRAAKRIERSDQVY